MPTRQRAVALRLAHTRAQLGSGHTAWDSSDVLPFSAWLARMASLARHGPLRGLRQLGAAEDWLLWRDAAAEACDGTGVFQPSSLADALRQAAGLARDWALDWPGDPAAEALVLSRARKYVERRCLQERTYAASDWSQVLRDAPRQRTPLLFAGCESFGPALRARLGQLGAEFAVAAGVGETAAANETVALACTHVTDELRRAAQWCRAGLERNPAARFLVVVPQLAQRRAAAVLAFDHELGGGALLAVGGESPYAIEGGRSLADYPMVATALGLLRLGAGPLEFPQLAPLLRSPYWECGSQAQRAALELLLRDRNVHAADLARLAGLARNQRRGAGAVLADALEALPAAARMPPATRATSPAWARRFAEALDAFGWPGGAALGSEEQQQHERFRALLGELALLGADSGPQLGHHAAVELLATMALRTAFEAASDDVPVTLTDSLDDPLVPYDGIWVAGLGAESWPAPPRADAFIPIAVQRAAGLPHASPQGQLVAALQAMAAWRRCAGQLVLSWPETDGDVVLQPSSLVAAPRNRRDPFAAPPPLADALLAALRRGLVREPRAPERALAWSRERPLPRGTRTLELQSMCPFRAAAELRLGAAPVAEPVPGLDRRERGQILHRTLQLIWEQLRDSGGLRARAAQPAALAQLVRTSAERSLQECLERRSQPLPAPLAHNELQRLGVLIDAMLQQELQRGGAAEFSVLQIEQNQDGVLAGVPVRVRMDRLDQLEDKRVIVIDYKSGAGETFHPLAERPRQPQLLAYALLAAAEVAGVAAVHLNVGEVRWRGAVSEAAVLPPLKPARVPSAPWTELLTHWRAVIDRLVNQFVAGDADVDPQPGACRLCHLPALCRIDAVRHAAASDEDASGNADANANGGNDAA